MRIPTLNPKRFQEGPIVVVLEMVNNKT